MATQMDAQTSSTKKAYVLQGTLLEACSCRTLCRCWIGEDPDGGACDAFNAYHIDKGEINGVDVSGLNYVQVVKIPGNVLVPRAGRGSRTSTRRRPRRRGKRSSMPGTGVWAARSPTSTV